VPRPSAYSRTAVDASVVFLVVANIHTNPNFVLLVLRVTLFLSGLDPVLSLVTSTTNPFFFSNSFLLLKLALLLLEFLFLALWFLEVLGLLDTGLYLVLSFIVFGNGLYLVLGFIVFGTGLYLVLGFIVSGTLVS
jgi:hypothetical protein